MIKLNKLILLITIIAIISSTTACSSITDTINASIASASNDSANSVINDVNNNVENIDKIESTSISLEFSFTPTSSNTIQGKCNLDTLVEDTQAHLFTTLTKNGSNSDYNLYLDKTNILFSLDGTKYNNFDLSSISSFAPKLSTILNIINNLNSANADAASINNQSSNNQALHSDLNSPDSKAPATDNDSNSRFLYSATFKNLLQTFLNISNSLTLDGTKNVAGHDMYVLKATINNSNINSLLDTTSSTANIQDNIISKLTSVDSIDVELYISASGENIIGFYANLSNISSTFFSIKSPENNYVQLLFGLNTSNKFQTPQAKKLQFTDILSLIPNILNFADDSSDIRDSSTIPDSSYNPNVPLKGLDLSSIFGDISISDILKKFDIKKMILSMIKDYVFGDKESLI